MFSDPLPPVCESFVDDAVAVGVGRIIVGVGVCDGVSGVYAERIKKIPV